ncbi:hypothetical protein B0A50_02499 [Salinomyces thailandicus]|uniref:Calponin-homology (CH) domain-containing protein n=1 Tax=Salinomyces thailandicus TaxID=706561 RepID=A0A4V5N588_9PEZI|nr:hypothetical protein B0A50_02499 [Salinomyces thailandica]
MASVTSLDQDMRNLRLSRYTPAAANEARAYLEQHLGHPLPAGDLLDALKDGTALCKLANLALPAPGLKFKPHSSMPFIQMENISHFLKACEQPPLSLPAHDRFLTVDLWEGKDPAQVLQCLGAFSRRAQVVRPEVFKEVIGPAKRGGAAVVSPATTGGGGWNGKGSLYGRPRSPTKGPASPSAAMPAASRALSPSLTGGSTGSTGSTPSRASGPVSTWSSRKDEGVTNPAWNIAQYGYMGGASQGNQGISFGARRQITSAAPSVPNAASIVRKRQQEEEEQQRLKVQAEEAEYQRRVEKEAEEERGRVQEERKWEEETRRLREEERRRLDEQKRQWEAQESRWREEEEIRRREEADVRMKLLPKKPPEKPRVSSQSILRGQSLADYQREAAGRGDGAGDETPEGLRVRELERQLEEARERERLYQVEREERLQREKAGLSRPSTADAAARPGSKGDSDVSWAGDEREFLRGQWQQQHPQQQAAERIPTPSSQTPAPEQPAGPRSPNRRPDPSQLPTEEPSSLPTGPSTSSLIIPDDPSSAPSSSPLGSPNRPIPTPEKEYRPYTPDAQNRQQHQQQPQSATFPKSPGSGRASPFARPQGPGGFGSGSGSLRSPFARGGAQAGRQGSPFAERPSFMKPAAADGPPVSNGSPAQAGGNVEASRQSMRGAGTSSPGSGVRGGGGSSSLLEREMERERARQREWEADLRSSRGGGVEAQGEFGDGDGSSARQPAGSGNGSGNWNGNESGGRRGILGPRPQR